MNALALLALVGLASPPPAAERPRLLVVIGVDQLIPEQLERLEPFFEGGYARFVKEGLAFRRGMLEHANTETGPGYATLGTGCHPSKHGIVANAWFSADGKGYDYCVGDPDATPVTDTGGRSSGRESASPRNLRVEGLGDWMKLANPESKVVSLAGKDRAAVGMGGHRPDLCLWWNRQSGGFMTSSWYAEELPGWVAEFNTALSGRIFDGPWKEGWKLELPDGIERAGTAPDEREGEASRSNVERLFTAAQKHTDSMTRRQILAQCGYLSPIADLSTLIAAELAVGELELGADEHPDLLLLGLSGCDVVGHSYGPYSAEVTDLLLRVDRALEDLFQVLDERVGADRWTAVLTSDHGVLMLPEEARRRGIDAVRVYDPTLRETFDGVRAYSEKVYGRDLVAMIDTDGVRLDRAALAESELDPSDVQETLAVWARSSYDWLERVYLRRDLESGLATQDPFLRLAQNCYDPERSPDIVFQARPWALLGRTQGTSHGSPYPYDRSVPIVFLGPGIEPGRRFDDASTADVAPTLLSLLGLEPPETMDGRVLPVR